MLCFYRWTKLLLLFDKPIVKILELPQNLSSEKKVKFLLVGAYALAVHGYPRSTMDIDLFVMPDKYTDIN